ncbi:hypothetical protein EMIT0P294_180055 [Pseudomonas sp. IT-P294]
MVYTDRSLNHMSQSFQGVMKNISTTLKQVYNALRFGDAQCFGARAHRTDA